MGVLVALDNLVALVDPLWDGSTGRWGRTGLLFSAAYLLGMVIAGAAAWRLAGSAPKRQVFLPVAIVAMAVAVRVAVAFAFDAPIYGENQIIQGQALGVLEGACCFSHRPMAYPITLAGAFALLGVGPTAVEALNLLFAAATAWLVWSIGRVGWNARIGAVAGVLYALMPSQVLMVLVPLTEPMFTLAVAATVRLTLELRRSEAVAPIAVGSVLAIGQYVRATAVSMLLPVLMIAVMMPGRLAARVRAGMLIVAAFGLLLLPVVAFNLTAHGDLSISTSAYGGWSMYVGANREHGGMWNVDDAARFVEFPGSSWWEKSEHAATLVAARIAEDPEGAARLLPRKFATMWGDEYYAATYALRSGPPTRDVHVAWLLSQTAYTGLIFLGAIGMFAARPWSGGSWRLTALLIGMMVTVVALSHLILEVHSRYHAYLVPLLCVLAAAGVAALVELQRQWRMRGVLSP
jgi:4-amino-4-deoxy-L-arabinose transferase-like glycosyltransferase